MNGVPVRDRKKAILLLAGSLYDFMPGPSTWRKNPLSHRVEPGKPSPSRKDLCGSCNGDGFRLDRWKRPEPCDDCNARGWHNVDAYTGKQVSTLETPAPSFTRRVMCDRCGGSGVWKHARCETCDGAGKVSVSVHSDGTDPDKASDGLGEWDRALERRDQSGSYHNLDVCLSELARRSHHRWQVFFEVHVARSCSWDELSPQRAEWLSEAVEDLVEWMPPTIFVPRDVLAQDRRQATLKGKGVSNGQRAERNAEWRERYEAGESPAAIAASCSVDRRTVERAVLA